MQDVIREGSLRLLATEASCDVIISCLGFKLMAHKIILSIASPVLQELLQENCTQQPTMLIFPDVAASTMSLILDYIYTGHVTLLFAQVADFLALTAMLQIKLDDEYTKVLHSALEPAALAKFDDAPPLKAEPAQEVKLKKLVPDLIPIARGGRRHERRAVTRAASLLFNKVIPSPWAPRNTELFDDPRADRLFVSACNDSNNNIDNTASSAHKEAAHYHRQHAHSSATTYAHYREVPPPPDAESITCRNRQLTITPTNDGGGGCTGAGVEEIAHRLRLRQRRAAADIDQRRLDDVSIDVAISPPLSAEMAPIKSKTRREKEQPGEKMTSAKLKTRRRDREKRIDKPDDSHTTTSDEQHQREEKLDKPFKCEDCGKQFSQLRNYKYHRSIHDGTKEFSTRCPECGKVFNDKGYLSSHMKIHRDRKEYACQHCPKRFNQRVAYNMHLRIHTGVKPHECSVCGKSFSRKMLLKQHQRVHTGERPYTCAECGKSFADRSNMSLHARLHTGVKPYSCTLCPKSFTKKHHLKTHMNFHTGLKPYSCEKCGLSFSQSSNMRTHYKKCILKDNNNSNSNNNNSGVGVSNAEDARTTPSPTPTNNNANSCSNNANTSTTS